VRASHACSLGLGLTEADPGLSGLPLSEAVRKAASAGQARRITRQNCGPTTKEVKQPPVARNASEWHRFRASVEITSLLKEEVFDDTSRFAPLSTECCLEQGSTNYVGDTVAIYPYVRYLPNAHKEHFLAARPKGSSGHDSRCTVVAGWI
jgi:hypothetical protein